MTAHPLPLIPTDVLERFHVADPCDTRFSSNARLLQSVWRERRGFPHGSYRDEKGLVRPLGSRLAPEVARQGHNLVTREIAKLARREAAYREVGALIEERRLWENLLSSQPMTFNLFGQAKLSPKFGRRLVRTLFPTFATDLLEVRFEHSPGRGDPRLTGDGTALDVAFIVRTPRGGRGFVGVEVKYSDTTRRPTRASDRLDQLAASSKFYRNPQSRQLRADQLGQLFAEHLLVYAATEHLGLYDEGLFVVIAPAANRDLWAAVTSYSDTLVDAPSTGLATLTVEDVIAATARCGEPNLAKLLRERYTDFGPVHDLIDDWEPHR